MKKHLIALFLCLFALPGVASIEDEKKGCDIMSHYWYVQKDGVAICSDPNDPCEGSPTSSELCINDIFNSMIADDQDLLTFGEVFCGGADNVDVSKGIKMSGNRIIVKCNDKKPGSIKIKSRSNDLIMGSNKSRIARFCQGLGSPKPSSKQCDGISEEKCKWLDKFAKALDSNAGTSFDGTTCLIYNIE